MIGYIAQMSMPEASTPSASAVLPLTTICGLGAALGRDAVLEVEVRLGPGRIPLRAAARCCRSRCWSFLPKVSAICSRASCEVEAVDAGTACPSTNMFLPRARVAHERAALALERQLVHPIAAGDAALSCVFT